MKLFPPAVFGFTLPAISLWGRFVSVANSRCGDLTGLSGLLSLIALCFVCSYTKQMRAPRRRLIRMAINDSGEILALCWVSNDVHKEHSCVLTPQ